MTPLRSFWNLRINSLRGGPYHQDTVPLAILTALIDPEEVRQAESKGTRPEAFFTALHLLDSIDDWLNGPSERYHSPEEIESAQTLKLGLIAQTWPLLDGEPFTFEDAPREPWCRHKTERNLREFLKKNEFPFHFFSIAKVPESITKKAYEMALAKDEQRKRKLDRERKRRRKKNQKNDFSTGNSASAIGAKHSGSGKKMSGRGKFKAASVKP